MARLAARTEHVHESGEAPGAGPLQGRRWSPLTVGLGLAWIAGAGAALHAGLDYYRLPLVERAYSPDRALFAPTGVVGHSLGYAGTLMVVVGVSMYVARKRVPALASVGRLSTWLEVHMFLCTLGPFLVLLHTSFKFGGIAAISFWSMAVAVASGLFGRYVYVRLPRTIGGQLRTLRAVEADREEANRRLAAAGGPSPDEVDAALRTGPSSVPRIGGALALAATAGFRRRAALGRLRRLVGRSVGRRQRRTLLRLAAARLRAEQQIAVLSPFQRLFRYWHVLHLPIAIVMFATLAVHLTVAFLFGYGWPL